MIARMGTFPMFALIIAVHVPTIIAEAFVTTDNYLWLLTIIRLTQHLLGTGVNFTASNLMYVNMPEADKTNYISFYVIVGNACAFLGLSTGTGIVAAIGDGALNIFGYAFTSVPVVIIVQGIFYIIMPVLTLLLLKHVKPEKEK